jgi:hypothetical protein
VKADQQWVMRASKRRNSQHARCGSKNSAVPETDGYVLEDRIECRMTFCTACIREIADGVIRYEVISEEFIRTEINRQMYDD